MRRKLHGHALSVIDQMMNAAVQNGVILAFVVLDVDHAGQIGAAAGGNAAPKFQCDMRFAAQICQHGGEARQKLGFVKVLGGEILYRKARAEFQLVHDKAQLFRQRAGKVIEHVQFALQPFERRLLRTGEVLQTADENKGMVGAAADDLDDLLFLQPELAAAGQTQQHMNGDAVARSQLAEQRKLTG